MAENDTDLDLDTKIAEAITQPKTVEIDGERIESHSIPDQIAGAKYLRKSRISTRHAFGGLGIAQISTPGAEE